MIKPILTEKSVNKAKKGEYSFWVDKSADKKSLKAAISDAFGVDIVVIRTINTASERGKNIRGMKFTKKGAKKAIVILKKGQKLDIYEKAKENS